MATRAVPKNVGDSSAGEIDENESTPAESVSRFVALHDESIRLLDAARTLVTEMRTALDDCRRRRPVVEMPPARRSDQRHDHTVKSHRGGRVGKKHGRRRWRRPR